MRAAPLLAAGALLLAACAHGTAATPAPQPDAEAVREALGACGPEGGSSCPAGTLEVERYVSPRAYRHLLAALLARQGDDLVGAVAELREALLYDPESAHLHTRLGELLLQLGQAAQAEAELRQALAHDPEHGPARLLLGHIEASRGRPDDARAQLRAAQEAQPDAPEVLRERIRLELSQGDRAAAARAAADLEAAAQRVSEASVRAERALPAGGPAESGGDPAGELLAQAARLHEEAALGWTEVARAAAEAHEDAQALDALARADAVRPGLPEAVQVRSAFLEMRGRFDEALQTELQLLAQRPEGPELLATLCRLSLEARDAEAAEAHLRKLIMLSGDLEPPPASLTRGAEVEGVERREARLELGGALLRAGLTMLGARRPGAATRAFEASGRLFPGAPEVLFHLALARLAKGRPREAAGLFDRVVQRLSEPAQRGPGLTGGDLRALLLDARLQAGLALGRAGESAESLRRLRALFDEQPLGPGVALTLVDGFDRAGKLPEAVALLEKASQARPGQTPLLYALAVAAERSQRIDLAVSWMRRVLAVEPEHAGALNFIGYSLLEQGGAAALDEAEPMLRRAVQLRPDDGAIADSYGLLLLRRGRAAEAVAELRRADALGPGDPVVLGHLGDALLAAGQRQEAELWFRRALLLLGVPGRRQGRTQQEGPAPDDLAWLGEEALTERLPEPGDARVRAELLGKLRALTTR